MDQESDIATTFLAFEPRRSISLLLKFTRTHAAELLSGALLVIMSAQMFAVISRKSITIDELVLIPAAYYHLVTGNFQLVNEHPALPKIVAAIPMLFIQPNEGPAAQTIPTDPSAAKWARQELFWNSNLDRVSSLSFWTRAAMIVFTAAGLGILIFVFARSLFGPRAAVLAVALFSLEPTVLGHGRVVHTDVPAAFGYLLFFMALYWFVRRPTWRLAAVLGMSAGVAILAKFSMLLVGLVLASFFILWWRRAGSPRSVGLYAAIVLLAILMTINAAYFFQHLPLSNGDTQWLAVAFPAHSRGATLLARGLSFLLPKDFVLGVFFQFWHNGAGHFAGLLGRYSQKGWWYYFPVAFLLKVTLPFLILTLASIVWATRRMIKNRDERLAWLAAPCLIYGAFVLFSHIDIGVRYLLPIFPFLFILGGAFLDQLFKAKRRVIALTGVLVLAWIGVEAVRVYPNHISYMNQLASRAPHWWYLSDSNVEWGDDLRELAVYLHERGENRVLDATLGGFGILRFYGIERVDALKPDQQQQELPRYLAIGASYLNGSTIPGGREETDDQRVNFFAAYRSRPPEAIIGDSIYVFRLR